MPTHYHDDHVAGAQPAARRRGHGGLGTGERRARARASPAATTCRACGSTRSPSTGALPLGEPFRWHEYELTAHPLPGHTLLRGRDRVRGRRPARRSRRGDQQTTAATARPQLPVPQPVPARRLRRERRALPRGSARPDHQRPLAAARGRRRLPRQARSPTAARLVELHGELLPPTSRFGDGGLRRADRAVPVDGRGAARPRRPRRDRAQPVRARRDRARSPRPCPTAGARRRASTRSRSSRTARRSCRFRVVAGAAGACASPPTSTVGGTRFGQQAEALVDVV